MNKALYFPLFVNDYEEVQLTTLKRKFGIKGYGIYTFLRTKLQDVDNYEYPIRMIADLSYMAGISEAEMIDIITNSGLFVIGNDYFSCPLLDEALNRHNGIKAKKSEQGKRGGQIRMSTLTPEERKELSQKGVEARRIKQPAQPATEKSAGFTQPTKENNAGCVGSAQPSNAGWKPDNEIEREIDREMEIEKEIEKKREKDTEIEKKNLPSSKVDEIRSEVDHYLKTESKFFHGTNINFPAKAYEQYRVQNPDTKMNSIYKFDKVFYYHLLKVTNTSNVQELNEKIKHPMSLNLSDVHNTFKLITSQKDVNSDYRNEVMKVMSTDSVLDRG